jgi:hypothetical protein
VGRAARQTGAEVAQLEGLLHEALAAAHPMTVRQVFYRMVARGAIAGVIAERAADPDMANVPGGRTGLLVRRVKVIGSGDNAREVCEYEVDTGLLKELRELEKQAAVEAGQWSTTSEVRGVVASVSVIPEMEQLRKLPIEELLRIHRESLGLTEKGR